MVFVMVVVFDPSLDETLMPVPAVIEEAIASYIASRDGVAAAICLSV
jgi:hypothetical protein